MLTNENITSNFGEVVLIYKGAAPFTEVHEGIPQGVVLQDAEGRIICYECKSSYDNLAAHIIRRHEMTADGYREKYGLGKLTPLESVSLGAKRAQAALARTDPGRHLPSQLGKKRNLRSLSMQTRNAKNSCPEQLIERMRVVIAALGPKGAEAAAREIDPTLSSVARTHGFSWNELKKLAGGTPNTRNKKKDQYKLIADVRAFVTAHGSLPFYQKKLRDADFPHSEEAYRRCFGSLLRAWRVCGIVKGEGYRKWHLAE